MRTFASLALIAATTISAAFAQSAPKKAPELTFKDPNGNPISLSSYKGKVVVLTFILTTCPHCQKESQMLSKLYTEMGPRGLQPLGVAVNADNAGIQAAQFVQQYGVNYPVGYATQDAMMGFLGISPMERWVVPQVAVIDRKGMIRAQSPYSGDPNLQTESYMRNLVDTLLKEGAASTTKTGTKAAPKSTAANHQH